MAICDCNEVDVVICGLGPTGALLSALLCRLRVKHIILEREAQITTDPRGIVLDEDGIRILQGIGLYRELFQDVGQSMRCFRFIEGGRGLDVRPFLQFAYHTIEGGTGHPGFMSHKQPVLEKHLRGAMDNEYGDVRLSSTVENVREDTDSIYVTYSSPGSVSRSIRAKFLVGADGKTGFVRKRYLEPKGIIMEKSPKFHYEAVWVALNWRLTLPTQETHPGFPLWQLGYSSAEVYDLFFPTDFNFICDPSRPSVCGRFGRHEDRLWRFEFVVKEGEDKEQMATKDEVKKIVFPYLTHKGQKFGLQNDIRWPEDCIEWIRSRPFSFSARSCNKWALGRAILCGDAAHVFPPFGGQGIASGFRDAISLSWRIKIATDPKCRNHESIFCGWYVERKQQLEQSLASTVENGNFCNEPSIVKAYCRNWYLWAVQMVPAWKHNLELGGRRDGMTKYTWAPGLHFFASIRRRSVLPSAFTDDTIFARHKSGIFQLVVILDSIDQLQTSRAELQLVRNVDTITGLRTQEATFVVHGLSTMISTTHPALRGEKEREGVIRVLSAEEYTAAGSTGVAKAAKFPRHPPHFYDPNRIRVDLGFDARYVIVRYDRFVFAACSNIDDLQVAVNKQDTCIIQA
ncbi:hypothetical protein B0O99DRAFT_657166 [Bisporella sp. PMI_857]|nr:hypothetical protein B0O99DRAFT_657166 [Bisporella sp. PMI_857]